MFTFPMTMMGGGWENLLSTSFNGVDEYVQTSVDFSGATEFTISGWYYRATAAQRIDITQSNNANSNRVKLLLNSTGPAVIALDQSSRTSSPLGTGWYHIVMVYDGSLSVAARIRLYVNGALEGNTVGTPPTSVSTIGDSQTLRLGQDNGSGVHSTGNLDEVTIWSNPLSAGEVTELYNAGTPLDPLSHSQAASLSSYYRMGDGDSDTTIFDNIGTDDGTLVNMDASNYTTDVPT